VDDQLWLMARTREEESINQSINQSVSHILCNKTHDDDDNGESINPSIADW